MLLVLVLEPLDMCDGILLKGRSGGYVEACYRGRDGEDGDGFVYDHVHISLIQ